MGNEIDPEILEAIATNYRKDLVQYQLDYSDKLEEIEFRLRGYRKVNNTKQNPDGEIYIETSWKQVSKPIMNDDGIGFVLTTIDSQVNKNVFLTDISRVYIENFIKNFHLDIVEMLCMRYKEFNLDPDDINHVAWTISPAIYYALKRAQGGGERTSLTTVRRIVEQIAGNEEPEKKRLPSLFGGMRK